MRPRVRLAVSGFTLQIGSRTLRMWDVLIADIGMLAIAFASFVRLTSHCFACLGFFQSAL
jgi:hypothetical protein